MKQIDPAFFHKLYGTKKSRVVYYKKDFIDYVLMVTLSALVVVFIYGTHSVMSIVGTALCVFACAMFVARHGIEVKLPLILRRPQDVLYLFIYKCQNIRPMYFIALGLLVLENILIAATPNLPHHVELMRRIALWLFYIHFLSITAFRTVILVHHLAKKELVREVLMQTPWQRVIKQDTNVSLEIVHAYCTGLLTHMILIAPWYLVILYAKFSLIFLPVVCLINIVVHVAWIKVMNSWFYRDHWLGHNSELEFIYLHGTHHDAIPSGLIAVAENGFLEGFMRYTLAFPLTFYNPIISFLFFTIEIREDMLLHQYIPGIFPRLPKRVLEIAQHSTHHYGPIEPYSLGGKLDREPGETNNKTYFPDEIVNSIKLDEALTNFQWDNPTYRRTLSLWDKYQK